MQESIVFLVRVQCRRKESSRSLSHLLMSFLSSSVPVCFWSRVLAYVLLCCNVSCLVRISRSALKRVFLRVWTTLRAPTRNLLTYYLRVLSTYLPLSAPLQRSRSVISSLPLLTPLPTAPSRPEIGRWPYVHPWWNRKIFMKTQLDVGLVLREVVTHKTDRQTDKETNKRTSGNTYTTSLAEVI